MLNAVDLTKHLRMRRHRNFVSVGSACQKSPQNRFVPVYKHCIYMGKRLTVLTCIYRVSQEERSIFWETIVSVILGKNV